MPKKEIIESELINPVVIAIPTKVLNGVDFGQKREAFTYIGPFESFTQAISYENSYLFKVANVEHILVEEPVWNHEFLAYKKCMVYSGLSINSNTSVKSSPRAYRLLKEKEIAGKYLEKFHGSSCCVVSLVEPITSRPTDQYIVEINDNSDSEGSASLSYVGPFKTRSLAIKYCDWFIDDETIGVNIIRASKPDKDCSIVSTTIKRRLRPACVITKVDDVSLKFELLPDITQAAIYIGFNPNYFRERDTTVVNIGNPSAFIRKKQNETR